MSQSLLFPANALTITLSATTAASASVVLPAKGEAVRIINEGVTPAYYAIGPASQTAVVPPAAGAAAITGCTPVLAGSDNVFSIDSTQIQQISVITVTGTATLRVQVGAGQ